MKPPLILRAAIAGSHEFDYDIPTLQRVTGQFNGTTFCGRVYGTSGETSAAAPVGTRQDFRHISGLNHNF